ncbi:MAG: Serine/threonine-protein kinase PknD [Candidatus Argoarchaeum ethanivorans]|uniref:non-specific serine/threonine protein kinase n=1 Tax=Candidatus Argoarchaeum ethanivorans TaxID=2608793 RepID=A0A811TC19_9EURY|nr:MAG: Serine/threonine-protein kinase PknD [Candidatus Argoarchaeum ethanivorans]
MIPERKTLTIGETWNLGNGYILTAQSIDAKATPRQVWFAISKDGHQLDDKVLSEGQTYTYGTIFSTRIDGIFRGTTSDMVQLKDTHFAPTGVQVTPAPTPIRITDYVRHTPTPQEDDSSIWGWVGLFAGLGALLVLWLSRKSESSAPTPVNSTKPTVSGGAGVSGDTSMQRADPHINEAKRVIQSAESALWGAMRKGVKIPQNTQQLLQDAKKALAAGDSASAKMYAHKCNKNVDATVKEFEQQKAEQARNEREQRALEQQRKEAREQIEIAIDSLEEARKLGISRMENAEHLLTIAQSFFDSRKYSEAKGNAEKCQDAINKLIEESKPNITLKLPSGMRHNYWKHYDIIITNNGTAHAKNITITFSKALETRELETIPKLNVGEQQTLRIKIRPTEAGDAPIDYSIKFSDLQDRAYEIERTTTIQISTSDETRAVPMHPAPVTPTAERLMEKYARLEYLGGGSFADVYKATKKDGGVVAVKVLRNLDERAENVFFREISIWEKLSHRNIVKLLSPHLKPVPHIEVEYVDGGNLYEALKTGEMDVQAACQIAFDIARALEYAHSKYVLHGDINPKNILLTSTGEAKITDFGLAKVATSSSIVKGYTLAYASKEQVEKGRAEEKTDIYQLGLTFYVMLTGANPFDAGSRYDTDERVRTYSPDPPGKYNPRAGGLDEIIMRCLSKDPGERPSTRELRECIYEFVKKNYSESLHLSEDVDTIISINCRLAMLAAKQGDLPECLSALRYALGKVSDQSARKELNKMIAWMEIRIKKDIVTDTEALADQMGILFKKVGWRW